MTAAGYSTREVAALLGITPRQVRSYAGSLTVQRGKRNAYRFAFRDVVLLRCIKGLRDAGIAPGHIERSLRKLRKDLPRNRDLSQLRIIAEGNTIVVHDESAKWVPESGQLVLDFEVSNLAREATPLIRKTAQQAKEHLANYDAEDWYNIGVDLDMTDDKVAAQDAFHRALTISAKHTGSHRQIGWIYLEREEYEDALRHFREAYQLEPDAETAFNIGTVLQELNLGKEAMVMYEEAIRLNPLDAAAYVNLGQLYEAEGRIQDALRTLSAARKLEK